jgi:hypothetical protein
MTAPPNTTRICASRFNCIQSPMGHGPRCRISELAGIRQGGTRSLSQPLGPLPWPSTSASGQTRKYSPRAKHFRVALNNGHSSAAPFSPVALQSGSAAPADLSSWAARRRRRSRSGCRPCAGQPRAPGVQSIADALNARGSPTPRGGRWYATSVRNVLARAC